MPYAPSSFFLRKARREHHNIDFLLLSLFDPYGHALNGDGRALKACNLPLVIYAAKLAEMIYSAEFVISIRKAWHGQGQGI